MDVTQVSVLIGVICLSHAHVEKSVVPGSLEEIVHARIRRATDVNKAGFTAAEKQIVLDKHNEFRRVPNAANMQLMFWDNELESIAQGWVNQCKYAHNSARKTAANVKPGENLYAKTPSYTAEGAVVSWNAEVSDYTYSSNTCASGKVCGHYTQVVWATSYKVGCGIKYCATVEGLSWSDVYLVACNYIAHGNFNGEKPYVEGAACSQCPADKTQCVQGLCSDGSSETIPPPKSGATSTSGVTTMTIGLIALSFILIR